MFPCLEGIAPDANTDTDASHPICTAPKATRSCKRRGDQRPLVRHQCYRVAARPKCCVVSISQLSNRQSETPRPVVETPSPIHPSILHPSIHSSIHSSVHSFIHSPPPSATRVLSKPVSSIKRSTQRFFLLSYIFLRSVCRNSTPLRLSAVLHSEPSGHDDIECQSRLSDLQAAIGLIQHLDRNWRR
jgi:hypothetical protein